MRVSSSAFYSWQSAPAKPFDVSGFNLVFAIKSTFKEHKMTLGSRRMVTELAKKNIVIGRYKARSAMRQLGPIAGNPAYRMLRFHWQF